MGLRLPMVVSPSVLCLVVILEGLTSPCWQATLASGWDVISPEEGYLTEELQERLQSCCAATPSGTSKASCGQHVQLRRGELLHDVDKTVRHFYFLIEVQYLPS